MCVIDLSLASVRKISRKLFPPLLVGFFSRPLLLHYSLELLPMRSSVYLFFMEIAQRGKARAVNVVFRRRSQVDAVEEVGQWTSGSVD